MKGIVLAGGAGTRLHPVTKAVNKHLLPVYDKPMIYYPISTLKQADITDIMVITTPRDLSAFQELLGTGEEFGLNICYDIQKNPNGIAEAFLVASEWIGNESVTLILGDNIFYGHGIVNAIRKGCDDANNGQATIFAYEISDPKRYGVIRFEPDGVTPIRIIEKPTHFVSSWAVCGVYCYPKRVADNAMGLMYSARGELEITDLNNKYMENGDINISYINSDDTWLDTGTHESLIEASMFVKTIQDRTNTIVGEI